MQSAVVLLGFVVGGLIVIFLMRKQRSRVVPVCQAPLEKKPSSCCSCDEPEIKPELKQLAQLIHRSVELIITHETLEKIKKAAKQRATSELLEQHEGSDDEVRNSIAQGIEEGVDEMTLETLKESFTEGIFEGICDESRRQGVPDDVCKKLIAQTIAQRLVELGLQE